MTAATEEWKPVEEFPEYKVSDWGRVVGKRGKILKPSPNAAKHTKKTPYYQVSIYHNGKEYKRLVHRLVARAFIGPPPTPEHEINHINFDTSDNRVENLEWKTKLENVRHSITRWRRGSAHPHAKLEENEVRYIRAQLKFGERGIIKSLAEEFGVSRGTIAHIKSRRSWGHL